MSRFWEGTVETVWQGHWESPASSSYFCFNPLLLLFGHWLPPSSASPCRSCKLFLDSFLLQVHTWNMRSAGYDLSIETKTMVVKAGIRVIFGDFGVESRRRALLPCRSWFGQIFCVTIKVIGCQWQNIGLWLLVLAGKKTGHYWKCSDANAQQNAKLQRSSKKQIGGRRFVSCFKKQLRF